MMSYVRPVQMNCPACGTTGIKPRIANIESRTEVVTEARWSCPRCMHYFHRGTVKVTPKIEPAQG